MKFGYELIPVAIIAIAALAYVIRFILPNITSEETDPGDDDESGPGIGARLRGFIPGNMVVKVATLVAWGLFLVVVSHAYPSFWKSWLGTGWLFWIAQLVVTVMVIFPIWQRSNNFGRLVVTLAVAVLLIGTFQMINGHVKLPIVGGSTATAKSYTPLSPESQLVNLKPLSKNPKREWLGPYVIPPGKQFQSKTRGPDGTRVYIRVDESDDNIYLEVSRSVGEPLLYKVVTLTDGSEALTPCGGMTGRMVEFLSGERDTKVILELATK